MPLGSSGTDELTPIPLVGVVHRSHHHAEASGYARLAEFIPGMVTIDGESSRVPYRIRRAVGAYLPGRGQNYSSASVSKELGVLGYFRQRRGGVVHYFDAERDAVVGPPAAGRFGWATAGSFHYPPAILRRVVSRKGAQHLDAAVALASNQAEYLSTILGSDRVHLIPLGVDTEFFTPPAPGAGRDEHHILTVGQHLRDFETFGLAVDELKRRIPTLQVSAVLLSAYHHLLPTRPWISLHTGIDDDALRSLYRRASCLLLPFTDAAGCTALLEAMACGLPVVTTDVGGTGDYVPDGIGERCPPGDPIALADAVSTVLGASVSAQATAQAAVRENALRFSLPTVSKQLEVLLRGLSS